jgi:hypothetical protein
MEYYLLRNGEQFGPYLEAALRGYLESGEARADDLAWHEGAEDWKPVAQCLTEPPDGGPAAEPASPRQQAFLAFMGVTMPPGTTRQQAAVLVNDAMENDPSRLARWNAERLKLHPDIFADEIQARKEGRAQLFFEHCQRDGIAWFEKVAKAHCQVLVAHLDVHSPNWDAHPSEAAAKYFFPALARKFPQLVTPAGRAHFEPADPAKTADAPKKHSSAVAKHTRPSPAGRRALAILRGAIYGALVLTGLWFGRGYIERPTSAAGSSPAAPAATPAPVEAEAPPPTTPEFQPAIAGNPAEVVGETRSQ